MITLNVENHGLTLVIDIDAKTQYPFQESFALYLVELERCVVLSCYNRMKQSRQTATNNN